MKVLGFLLSSILLIFSVCFGAGSAAIHSDNPVIVTGVVANGDDYDVFAATVVAAAVTKVIISHVTWSGDAIVAGDLCEIHDASGNVLIPYFVSVTGDEAFGTPYLGIEIEAGGFLINQMDHGTLHIYIERVITYP